MKWEILNKKKAKSEEEIIKLLLKNRKINNAESFLKPIDPNKIKLKEIGLIPGSVKKAINRLKKAKKNKERVIIYGDYDADGICATAILWEALNAFGVDVLPYIPDRFTDGYGIKSETVNKILEKDPTVKLIITVDNGIVAYEGIKKAKKSGVDTIIIDHHQKGAKKPVADIIIHSVEVCGSALAWFVTRQLGKGDGLELAAIGTVADQMPLVGPNRSLVKWGLPELSKTKRPGIRLLLNASKIEEVGTYEVNYIIAPRINAMGRLAKGLDSLRFLCTKNIDKAKELNDILNRTNVTRQQIVERVVIEARKNVTQEKIIVISGTDYHEGVIGLAAGKLVEEFYRPAIVLSENGDIAKGSARSVSGFNIIEAIRGTGLILEGGGHPMAAGFSIELEKIEKFRLEINKIGEKILNEDVLSKKLKIDLALPFKELTFKLSEKLKSFDPVGIGNPAPVFMSEGVEILSLKAVGQTGKHLKLKLKQDEQIMDAIYFGGGEIYPELASGLTVDVAYNLEENIWNGRTSLQIKIRDVKV